MLPVLNLTPTLSFWAKNGEFLLKGEKISRVFAIAFCFEQILHFRSENSFLYLSLSNPRAFHLSVVFWAWVKDLKILCRIYWPQDDGNTYYSLAIVSTILKFNAFQIAEPNINSPANVDAAKMYRDDRRGFRKLAHKHTRKSLGITEEEAVTDDEDEVQDTRWHQL